jgi:hypothetical protein
LGLLPDLLAPAAGRSSSGCRSRCGLELPAGDRASLPRIEGEESVVSREWKSTTATHN